MKKPASFAELHQLRVEQEQAGVDPEMAELVCAYARLRCDRGVSINFYDRERPGEASLRPEFTFFQGLEKRNPAMDPRTLTFLKRYGKELLHRKLPVIFSTRHLARKLRMTEGFLALLGNRPERWYRAFSIPKKDGSARQLHAPVGRLRTAHRWIKERILDKVPVHRAARGFVRNRSILDNARPHAGRRLVVNLDLENFFPSVPFSAVRRVFQDLGYTYGVATVLARICCLEGGLPQGAPTSPALSNLVARRMDRRFTGLARTNKFRYTRYADDLTFSSNDIRLPQLIPLFRQVIGEEGFRVNEKKVRIMGQGTRQQVTGLVVNRRPTLARERVRQLRSAADWHRSGDMPMLKGRRAGSDPVQVLQGHLGYLRMVSPQRHARIA